MNKSFIRKVRRSLIDWYRQNQRDLPWRKTANAYHIWVSEVMLQQTQVATVLPYYHGFLNRFPDLKHLARADLQDVLKAWEGLGYYARARNLQRAVQIVVNEQNGIIPDEWGDFRKLPGVGDYIAAAVLSIAFGQAYAVIDGNVKRVLARLLIMAEPVNKASSAGAFRKMADILLDPQQPGTFNQAMMELGAVVCRPQRPLCGKCTLQKMCAAHKSARVSDYPRKLKKPAVPQYHIAVGVVFKNGRVLITRRKSEGLLGGLWEFPGGKIRKGETAAEACVREMKEEVNLTVTVESMLSRVKHAYTHFKVIMDIFCCRHVSGRVRLTGPVDHRWIRIQDLDDYPLPKANHKFIPKLTQCPTFF